MRKYSSGRLFARLRTIDQRSMTHSRAEFANTIASGSLRKTGKILFSVDWRWSRKRERTACFPLRFASGYSDPYALPADTLQTEAAVVHKMGSEKAVLVRIGEYFFRPTTHFFPVPK